MKVAEQTFAAALQQLANGIEGEVHYDETMRILYATDASVYRELPLAVTLPKSEEDIRRIILFAKEHQLSIIPRAAGTSLAGQCVGNGIVVDISRHMNQILEFNPEERWIRVQPGIVRNELNHFLKPHGLFFSPITSTASRCMIGGMVGNNSCGTTSIVYGSTRDHVLELKTLLSDGSEAVFSAVDKDTFHQKRNIPTLEGKLYDHIYTVLSKEENRASIREEYPKASIHRRNTGYAIDLLMDTEPFDNSERPFDFCKLLCGSEGTLAFTTEIKLHLDPLPAPSEIVVCAHFNSLDESLRAVQVAMQHQPTACELMDKIILDCTRDNIEQQKNRFFVEGDPAAVLMIEFRDETLEGAELQGRNLIEALKEHNYGYTYPIVRAPRTKQVWALRSAGLGLLANLPGDPKAVACIEDTAVDIEDLPEFIEEFSGIMAHYGQRSVYYAHAGAGEIHLRPILDLKKTDDRQLFYDITEATAKLVKKYHGSLSGEHGDGRVRAAFIPLMIGEHNYQLLRDLKQAWDPGGVFNPGKIVDAAPMNASLRYEADQKTRSFDTILDFSDTGGILRMAEKCNGSGDCRKLPESGGTMCPSFMATRNEKETTRGRANVLREILTRTDSPNPFDSEEIFEVMKLCLSCKGCTSECPSSVDMSALKAEFTHQYYQSHRRPLSNLAFGHFPSLSKLAMTMPALANWTFRNRLTATSLKSLLQVAPERTLPPFASTTLKKWFRRNAPPVSGRRKGKVYFFADEFTNYNDVEIGQKAIRLLSALGYEITIPKHVESSRTHLSKGLLLTARKLANQNIDYLSTLVSEEAPLIGLEPSAILSFRDEYPRLARNEASRKKAQALAKHTFMIEEFLEKEIQRGNITAEQFGDRPLNILLHGHCHQKALSTVSSSAFVLSLPPGYNVSVIPSGCCGMAGSFGYEKENYEVSMKIGELVLFPAVRNADRQTSIAAPGTSCRHQIMDGTGREASHPVELLYDALREQPK